MKINTSLLLYLGLFVFQQQALAEHAQRYQSLSIQEKQSACVAMKLTVMPDKHIPCETMALPANETVTSRQSLSISTNESATDQMELLLVERHIPEKGILTRMADVYTYNYTTDTLNHSVINVRSGQVLRSNQLQNIQLPLTETEINRARSIASDDLVLHGYLEQEYHKITGQSLHSLDQLVIKAFIFLSKSMPDVVNIDSKTCGLHRCARLVMHTENRIALETSPIINLSIGVVSQYMADNK